MPQLRNERSQSHQRLLSETTVGRSRSCVLRLDDPRASSLHAVLAWNGSAWELRDLGSRNGTFVNGRRLESGERELLESGIKLGFGGQDQVWTLVGDEAPVLGAQSAIGEWAEAQTELLTLPSPESPEVVVYADEKGQWVLEQGHDSQLVEAGFQVQAGGKLWTLDLPQQVAPTAAASRESTTLSFSELHIAFKVSSDEENVLLDLQWQGHVRQIPHRAQNYLLLTLARARQEDMELEPGEQGWCYRDDMIRGLRIPENQFNVAVFRARQHLSRAGVIGAKAVVERRRGSTQLRLGTDRFEIVRL